ncbi:MAG: hypothetical protein I3J02_02375 [Prevotella sp.]|nr:hypothetical protein [Prevotella sp.]
MAITKKKYLEWFLIVTLVLGLTRVLFPSVAKDRTKIDTPYSDTTATSVVSNEQNLVGKKALKDMPEPIVVGKMKSPSVQSRFFHGDGSLVKNRIYSVPGYQKTFDDQQDVQYLSAEKWGVSPVQNRNEAERRKAELVYVGSNPYFHIDKLHNSIPYLVPRASILLQDIGCSFFDSLQIKGVPLHKLIVTSVMRTKDDVAKLRSHNGNATQNSCHLYGTTFDVCYNRYQTVEAPGEKRRQVRNDTLKYILAEVLRDMRESGRCHVKYEVKQGCFHITVK